MRARRCAPKTASVVATTAKCPIVTAAVSARSANAPSASAQESPSRNDPKPPSTPGNLVLTGAMSSSLSISWTASIDKVGVTAYIVYLNGAAAGSTPATNFTFDGLSCETTYQLAVSAGDAAGNESGQAELTAAT